MRLLSLFVSLATASVVFSQSYRGYIEIFHGLSGATEADDYLTFKLAASLDECMDFCDSVQGCHFVNIYHDVNGKNGSPLFTCSLYERCHGPAESINTGGQSQPDGSIDYIVDSDGWCKKARII